MKTELSIIGIENGSTDAAFNLALEESLFLKAQESGESFVFLWRNSPSVIVGKFQNTAEEVNLDFVKKRGLKVIRRITGGGAVFHDLGNLNYTMIFPIQKQELNFILFGEIICESLRHLGAKAELLGRNDILIGGQKISGCAQHISKNTLLHHGTLLFDSNLDDMAAALDAGCEKFASKAIQSVRSRVTNIKPHLPTNLDMSEFREHLAAALNKKFAVLTSREPNAEEISAAMKLRGEKYGTWDWNWGKSPPFTLKLSKRFSSGRVDILLNVEGGIVKNCSFQGDFFSAGNPDDIARLIVGKRYPIEDCGFISDALIAETFCGINPVEFRGLLEQK